MECLLSFLVLYQSISMSTYSGRPDDALVGRGGDGGRLPLHPAEGARQQVLRAADPAPRRQRRVRRRLLGLLHTRLAVPQ